MLFRKQEHLSHRRCLGAEKTWHIWLTKHGFSLFLLRTFTQQSLWYRSVDTLATTSRAFDMHDGVITSYTPTDGNFEQGKDIVDMVMKVTRNGQPYEVHIKIELVGNDWKILSADGI